MTDPTVDADAFNAFEAAGWEQQVAGYEAFFVPITSRLVGPLLDAAEVGRGARVLDVASGPGHVAAAAAERGASVVGVDVAEGMLSLARRLHPELEFRHGDAEALPFPDGSFDAVVANFAMLHVGRPELAAAEFARVLAPDGRLALTVWDVPERARFVGVLVEAMAAAGAGPPQHLPAGPPIFRFSDDHEFADLLRGRRFEDIEVETVSFSHRLPSIDALWRGLLGGTVRTSALVRGQTSEMQRQIRAAFDRSVQQYEVDAGLELPVSVKLASGRKPASAKAETPLLQAFLDGFNAHDVDAIMSFFTDDCVFDAPRGPAPGGRHLVGKQQVREGIQARFDGIPDIRYEHERHWTCGDRGVSEWTIRGTQATGEPIEVRGCDLFEFTDGKISRKDSFWKIID